MWATLWSVVALAVAACGDDAPGQAEAERARLLAAGSKILSQINDVQLAVEQGDYTGALSARRR